MILFIIIRKKNFIQGPPLPQKCHHGSMVTLPFSNQAILLGCSDVIDGSSVTAKIFKLTWQGEHLQWVTLQQELKFPRHSAVAMLTPGTHCKYLLKAQTL